MSLKQLENLVKIGQLKAEPFNLQEYNGLIRSGEALLKDANNVDLSPDSRFDLAYNAAHSLALAALRKHGYRSANHYAVFQVLPFTLGVEQEVWRILDMCHNRRNVAEYEGYFEVDEKLLVGLLGAVQALFEKIKNQTSC